MNTPIVNMIGWRAPTDHAKCHQNQFPKDVEVLTNREIEVLTMIGLGYSIKEISGFLFLSTNTVATHRSSIKEKLQCRKATTLAVIADRMGLLTSLTF